MPKRRQVMSKGDERIEAYFFPAGDAAPVARFATVGVSNAEKGRHSELEFVVPADLGGAEFEEVISYLFEKAIYFVENSELQVGDVLAPNKRCPPTWEARAILVGESVGESEALSKIAVGDHSVALLWLIPLHDDEYVYVRKAGVHAFLELERESEWSMADPNRPSVV
jgi:hypothetical protein